MFYLPEDLDKVAAIGEAALRADLAGLEPGGAEQLSGLFHGGFYCLTYWMGVMPSICLKLRRQALSLRATLPAMSWTVNSSA